MNVRRTTLLIAIVLAVGTGLLTLTYLNSLRPQQSAPRQVLIASQDIPARIRITAAMVHTDTRPANALEPDAISNPDQAVGSLALITIPAGAQLTSSQIGNNVPSALPVRLEPGMRAVSIPIDRVKGVSGMIEPGDRVDVIAIPPNKQKAVTIFRGLLVLAVGTELENASATPSPQEEGSATVTLAVNPKQADMLAWADSNATLRLALRSPREALRSEPTEQLTINSDNNTSLPPPAPAPVVAAPPMLAAAAPAPRVLRNPVELIVGDQIVDPGPGNAH
jgi:pilus assembly protein CpaB